MTDHLSTLYSGFSARLARTPDMGIDAMRDLFDGWHRGTAEHEPARYAEATGAPLPATWCRADDAGSRTVIVYAHGGGFVVGSRDSHRKLGGHLAGRSGTAVLVVDYRRAPEHPFPAAIDDLVATARWLIDQGYRAENIAFAGDSAGGNLAVNAALRMIRDGAAPGAVLVLSPWIDLANTGSSLEENAGHDAMVDRPTLEVMTGLYLAGESPVAPHANPLHADLSQLPPLFVTASRHETLRDDAVRLADRVQAHGGSVVLELAEGQQHVFQMGAGRSAVADESLDRIGRWLRSVLAHAESPHEPADRNPRLAGGVR